MTKKQLKKIENRIEKIKVELYGIGEMRPGSLTEQYKNSAKQTGSYYQLSYTFDMNSRTEYIRKENVSSIKQQIKNYKRLKKLIGEWICLSIEHSRLTMKLTSKQQR